MTWRSRGATWRCGPAPPSGTSAPAVAFEGLFYGLRARGVPVAMDEWLGLQDALSRGLADSSLSRFYLWPARCS